MAKRNPLDDDILLELRGADLQRMADHFTITEDHIFTRTLLLHVMRNRRGRKSYPVTVCTPISKPEGNEFVFCFTRYGPSQEIRIYVLYPTAEHVVTRVADALFNTNRINFNQVKEVVFKDIDMKLKPAVLNFMSYKKQYSVQMSEVNDIFTMSPDFALELEDKIPENTYLRPLEERHAGEMYAVRDHPNLVTSEYFIKNIRLNGGYVLFSNITQGPVAWGLKTLTGGFEYVDVVDSPFSDSYAEAIIIALAKDLASINQDRPVLALTYLEGASNTVLQDVGFKVRMYEPKYYLSIYFRLPEFQELLENKPNKKKKKKKKGTSPLNISDIKISPDKGRVTVAVTNPVMTRHIPKDEPQPRPSRENSPRSDESIKSEYDVVNISLPELPGEPTKIVYSTPPSNKPKVGLSPTRSRKGKKKVPTILLEPGPSSCTIRTVPKDDDNDTNTKPVNISPLRVPEILHEPGPSTSRLTAPSDIFEPRISPRRTRSSRGRTTTMAVTEVKYPTSPDPPETPKLGPADTCGQPSIKVIPKRDRRPRSRSPVNIEFVEEITEAMYQRAGQVILQALCPLCPDYIGICEHMKPIPEETVRKIVDMNIPIPFPRKKGLALPHLATLSQQTIEPQQLLSIERRTQQLAMEPSLEQLAIEVRPKREPVPKPKPEPELKPEPKPEAKPELKLESVSQAEREPERVPEAESVRPPRRGGKKTGRRGNAPTRNP